MEAEIKEADLVRRIIAGDETGFELLVRRHGSRMLARFRRAGGRFFRHGRPRAPQEVVWTLNGPGDMITRCPSLDD